MKYIVTIVSIIFLSILSFAVYYYYQYGDDFVFLLGVEKHGVIGNMIYKYMNWDGRHLSFAGFVQMFYFKYLNAQFSIVLGLFFLMLSIGLFFTFLDIKVKRSNVLLVFSLFMVGMIPFYKEVVIWQTGIVYLVFMFQSSLTLVLYKKYGGDSFMFFTLIFLLSLNSQNFNFFSASIIFSIAVLEKKLDGCKSEIFAILAIILGTLIVSIAPGNLQRINYQTAKYVIEEPLYEVFGKFFIKSILYSKYLLFAGFLASYFLSVKKFNIEIYIYTFIFSAFASLFPFLFVPESLDVRIIFPIGVLFFFSGVLLGEKFGTVKYKVFSILSLCFLLGGCIYLSNQVSLLKSHGALIVEREKYLLGLSPNADAVYKYLDKPEDLIISRSPTYETLWRSEFLEYYNLESFNQFRE